ncbi:glycosyltransferase family 2 protein [Marinomonas transparens]|uniref:Glycosyltransferase family 2 protein n=1 Tax=Marinomonas transparens TaxID=2795388 RepID=A0A934JWR3_9GAMM|nr:glycosyltransferase family 2 protein [Marinomonas transparens]MBJ7538700.1 glycosyltransferase family 2 protein [Marinomonas transparens]
MDESVSNNNFKPAIIIPVYNHEDAISTTLDEVLVYGYPIVLVNDGSSEACTKVLQTLANRHNESVHLLHLNTNSGKGAAVKSGMKYLLEQGFSHALQVDADGQHNVTDIPVFMRTAELSPASIISGYPIYDQSVPRHRYYARYLTHVWVWINTLSFTIKDSMCGFRVYPLHLICAQLNKSPCGDRMDFDTEIIVRWIWTGHPVKNIPTRVRYPENGISHFNAVKDNLLISWMHTRLFFGMVWRLPPLLWRKFNG